MGLTIGSRLLGGIFASARSSWEVGREGVLSPASGQLGIAKPRDLQYNFIRMSFYHYQLAG
jgi:hypothetical protein